MRRRTGPPTPFPCTTREALGRCPSRRIRCSAPGARETTETTAVFGGGNFVLPCRSRNHPVYWIAWTTCHCSQPWPSFGHSFVSCLPFFVTVSIGAVSDGAFDPGRESWRLGRGKDYISITQDYLLGRSLNLWAFQSIVLLVPVPIRCSSYRRVLLLFHRWLIPACEVIPAPFRFSGKQHPYRSTSTYVRYGYSFCSNFHTTGSTVT